VRATAVVDAALEGPDGALPAVGLAASLAAACEGWGRGRRGKRGGGLVRKGRKERGSQRAHSTTRSKAESENMRKPNS
jgi:hypothetical protein